MTIFKDVLTELFAMFVGDARLTAAILAVIIASASLIDLLGMPSLAGGVLLLIGSLATLIVSVCLAAGKNRQDQ